MVQLGLNSLAYEENSKEIIFILDQTFEWSLTINWADVLGWIELKFES